jgi:two-component system LytT family response regulator
MINDIHPAQIGRLVVRTMEGTFFLSPQDIIRLEADDNYTSIFFVDKPKLFTAKVLKQFAAILEPIGFIRTHRTHLVNRDYISSISQDGKIRMKDDSVAEISRRQKREVMRLLQHHGLVKHLCAST